MKRNDHELSSQLAVLNYKIFPFEGSLGLVAICCKNAESGTVQKIGKSILFAKQFDHPSEVKVDSFSVA